MGMKRGVGSVLVVLWMGLGCSSQDTDVRSAPVINGDVPDAGHPVWKYTVKIDLPGNGTCTGVFGSATKIISAAHCFYTPLGTLISDPSQYAVRVSNGSDVAVLAVADVVLHPHYDAQADIFEGARHDVAVITLADPVPPSIPVAVPERARTPLCMKQSAACVDLLADQRGDADYRLRGAYRDTLRFGGYGTEAYLSDPDDGVADLRVFEREVLIETATAGEDCRTRNTAAIATAESFSHGRGLADVFGEVPVACVGDSGGPWVDPGSSPGEVGTLVGLQSLGSCSSAAEHGSVFVVDVAAPAIASFLDAELGGSGVSLEQPDPLDPTLPFCGPLVSSYLDVAVDGVGLSHDEPTSLTIAGIGDGSLPIHSRLYWMSLGPHPSVTLAGSTVTGVLVGTGENTCWTGTRGGLSHFYVADVSDIVHGNDVFALGNTGDGAVQGASLVYLARSLSPASGPDSLHVWQGLDVLVPTTDSDGHTVPDEATVTLPTVAIRNHVQAATLLNIVADGQSFYDQLHFDPGTGFVELEGTDAFPGAAGDYWDVREDDVTALMNANVGLTDPKVKITTDDDCLAWGLSILHLEEHDGYEVDGGGGGLGIIFDETAGQFFQQQLGPGGEVEGVQPILDGEAIDPAVTELRAAADVDGDGMHDLVWRDEGGASRIWKLADGGTTLGQTVELPTVSPQIRLVGAADFGEDGTVELLWQEEGTDRRWMWNIDPVTLAKTGGGRVFTSPGPAWQLVATGDLDGDRQPDLLWRHSDGYLAVWRMGGLDGRQRIDGIQLRKPDGTRVKVGSQWSVIGLVDMTGEGRSEILFRKGNTDEVVQYRLDYAFGHLTGYFGSVRHPSGADIPLAIID